MTALIAVSTPQQSKIPKGPLISITDHFLHAKCFGVHVREQTVQYGDALRSPQSTAVQPVFPQQLFLFRRDNRIYEMQIRHPSNLGTSGRWY